MADSSVAPSASSQFGPDPEIADLPKIIGGPLLFIVSGPSGGGKTTLCDLLMRAGDFTPSVSVTTRAPRGAEEDGLHYHFKTDAQFDELISGGQFMEWARVHGHRYGTLSKPVMTSLLEGKKVLLNKDVQGHAQIRAYLPKQPQVDPERIFSLFICPMDMGVLESRLAKRSGTDQMPYAEIKRRLEAAKAEISRFGEFDCCINSTTPQQDCLMAIEHINARMSRL